MVRDSRPVVKRVSLAIKEGEVHVLLGPNGAGKSTLLAAIAGLPNVRVSEGLVVFNGAVLNNVPPWERCKRGISLAHQHPPKLRGVTLRSLAEAICRVHGTPPSIMEDYALRLGLLHLMDRSAFAGFSGGEAKKAELLLALLTKPKLLLLDEPDSGVDVDSVKVVASVLNELVKHGTTMMIVTHTGRIVEYLESCDQAHVMVSGELVRSGPAEKVLDEVLNRGFTLEGVVHETLRSSHRS